MNNKLRIAIAVGLIIIVVIAAIIHQTTRGNKTEQIQKSESELKTDQEAKKIDVMLPSLLEFGAGT